MKSLVSKRSIEVRDLDETVTREEVVAALCIALGKSDLGDQFRLYKCFSGVQTAVVRLNEADARSLLGLGRLRNSMYWWSDQLSVLRRKCVTARWRFTRSKGDPLLREAWKKAKSALRKGMKKSRLQCWKDLIGEVEKDPSGLVFKIVTKRLVTRRKTPGLDDPDRVK